MSFKRRSAFGCRENAHIYLLNFTAVDMSMIFPLVGHIDNALQAQIRYTYPYFDMQK